MDIQWYPGHMTKARRQMEEDIRLVDMVIELVDARVPSSSRNPDIDALSRGKLRILLMNKADLADEKSNALWLKYYKEQGMYAALLDSRVRAQARQISSLIGEAAKEKRERDARRGIVNRPVRAMIAGIPNVGKSTFINSYAGKAAAKTGNKPGVTRGKQWIRMSKDVELLDTPGILWPKFDDQTAGYRLAAIGSIRDEVLERRDLAMWVIDALREGYPEQIGARYSVEQSDDTAVVLERVAVSRGCLKKDGEPDYDRAAALILDDLRSGRLGRITLELPENG